jgi:hypothetical protein
MKAALVNAQNIVENVIVWDETCVAPDGVQAIVLEDLVPVSIGWKYQNNEFIDLTPPPPQPTKPDLIAEFNLKVDQLAALKATIDNMN